MPKELEHEFEKEYGKKRGDLIFYKWESKHHFKIPKKHNLDYCAKCRKRTEHIKNHGIMMCKHCGHQEKY